MTRGGPDVPAGGVAALFDVLAGRYDAPPLRYFSFAADELVTRLAPAPGAKVLDVGAGTGAVTLAAAQAVGPSGRVIAIDLSEQMLAQLDRKIRQFGVSNVDVHLMDAMRLDFRHDYFHHVVCGFALFIMPDMAAALRGWRRVLRAGGRVMFTSFGAGSFEPMRSLYFDRLEALLGRPIRPPPRLSDPAACCELLEAAGFGDVRAESGRIGYHLKDPAEWWEIVWSTPLRSFLRDLDSPQLAEFRAAHLADVGARAGPDGVRLEVEPIYAGGTKPEVRLAVSAGSE